MARITDLTAIVTVLDALEMVLYQSSDTQDYKITIQQLREFIQDNFDVNSLTSVTIADADELLINDNSDSNNPKKVTHAGIKSDIQDVNSLTSVTIADADELLINDNSDSNNPKKVTHAGIKSDIQDVNSLTSVTIADADELLINDNSDSNNPKKVTHAGIKSDIQDVNSLTEKTTLVNADELLINDSADSNNPKKVTLSNLNKSAWYDDVISATGVTANGTISLPAGYSTSNTVVVGTRILESSSGGDIFYFSAYTVRGTSLYYELTGAASGNEIDLYFYLKQL